MLESAVTTSGGSSGDTTDRAELAGPHRPVTAADAIAPPVPAARRPRQLIGAGATRTRTAARTAAQKAAGVAGRVAENAGRVAGKVSGLPASLPSGVREQIRQSAQRLSKVRSVKGAKKALIQEAERLFLAVTPLLAAAPLPVSGWQARLAAGGAGGAGAAVEQAEELAAVVSWGGALPTVPVVAGAVVTAWVLELWIALSARVNQLKAAGRQVDADLLGRELAGAYLGDPDAARRGGMGQVVRRVAVRAAERWAAGLVPGVGIAFDSYSSQRTVARILREPVTAHPPIA